MTNENVVFVGNKKEKNAMDYALAILTQINNGAHEIIVKGRGRAISRVFDATEIVKNNFSKGIEYKLITPSTETFKVEGDSRIVKVTSIEVVLAKK